MNMISTYDYDLEIDSSISNIYKIRNSRLWAILEDKTLLYSDLSYNPKPFVKIFSNLTDCEAIFVSPDGEFCLVRTKTDHFHILIQNLIPQQSPIMPGTKVISATFSNIGKISVLPEYRPYIENFSILLAPEKAEKINYRKSNGKRRKYKR